MSGIEVAGLVVPLLLTAFENWESCVLPFKRLKKFDEEARNFCDEVEIQRSIFRNECGLLLHEVKENDLVSGMLEYLGHKEWRDEKIDADLARLLGGSLQGVQLTVKLLNEELGRLSKDTMGLSEVVKLARQTTPKISRNKAWKRSIGEKLRFSLSETRLNKGLSKLESLNNSLVLLCNQTKRSVSSNERAAVQRSDLARANIQRYQAVGKVSRQVYKALSRACTKHTEHLAHFGVEAEHVEFKGDLFAQVKFNMAFTHQTLNGLATHSEPIWFLMDSVIDERVSKASEGAGISLQSNELFLKREGDCSSKHITKRQKRVRFDAPETTLIPNPISSIIINTESLDRSRRYDFCDYLRQRFCRLLQKDACVVLEHTTQCKHFVLPSSLTGCAEKLQALSLGQLIRPGVSFDAIRGVVTVIPIHERIKLAKVLAVTVLQYHDTPWLSQLWTSEDIYFFEARKDNRLRSPPNISAPHLNAIVTDQEIAESSTTRNIARNPFLFSLGAVMIELAYGASLDQLQQPCDRENGVSHTRFFTARRLAKQADSPMGARYDDIVERLVECVFMRGDNLNDNQVQWKVYEDVVCPLEKLGQDFERLYLANGKDS